jgi:hypothetical protein
VAEHAAAFPHVGPPTLDVARGNQDFRAVAILPEIEKEDGAMRQIGIHRHDVRRGGRAETGKQRAAVAAFLLHDDARAAPRRRLARSILRACVGNDDFRDQPQLIQHFLERRKQEV